MTPKTIKQKLEEMAEEYRAEDFKTNPDGYVVMPHVNEETTLDAFLAGAQAMQKLLVEAAGEEFTSEDFKEWQKTFNYSLYANPCGNDDYEMAWKLRTAAWVLRTAQVQALREELGASRQENIQCKQELARAREVIEFYGNEENWVYGDQMACEDDWSKTDETREGYVRHVAGAKARKFLGGEK